MVATKKIVLASERYGTNFVLDEVVVEFQPSVFKDAHHVFPSGVGIGDGLADESALAVMDSFCLHLLLHLLHDRSGFQPTLSLTRITLHAKSVTFVLDSVQFAYFAKEP